VTEATPAVAVVHVAGAVVPGVYRAEAGAAPTRRSGRRWPTPDADIDVVNLARWWSTAAGSTYPTSANDPA
jgi:hypothetical protein